MHCYEYLAMHMQLKAEIRRLCPGQTVTDLGVDELLCSLGVNNIQELQEINCAVHFQNSNPGLINSLLNQKEKICTSI